MKLVFYFGCFHSLSCRYIQCNVWVVMPYFNSDLCVDKQMDDDKGSGEPSIRRSKRYLYSERFALLISE